MEKNTNVHESNVQIEQEEQISRRQYTKQQNALYTIISIGLFCLLYFGGKGIMQFINRPYYCFLYPETVSEEKMEMFYSAGGISSDANLILENARLYKDKAGYSMEILFSGIADKEIFEEEGVSFEYGDVEEDVRVEFYPYADNLMREEYVFADKYSSISEDKNMNGSIYLFEYENKIYAKYQEHSLQISPDVRRLFDGCEKVY